MKKKVLFLLIAVIISGKIINAQSSSVRNWKSWPYKGYIGITPIYIGGNGFNLGWGIEGEFALPRLFSARVNLIRDYFELDKTSKKSYILDYGISFHPLEWMGEGKFSSSTVRTEKTSYNGGQTWSDPKQNTYNRTDREECLKRINFRAGLLSYRYNYNDKITHNYDDLKYVESTGTYLGISFLKVGLVSGQRRQYSADVIFQKSVEVPERKAISDTCTMRTGFRLSYLKGGRTGGGTYEFGLFPGLNSKPYFYFKVAITINAVFIKGFKL